LKADEASAIVKARLYLINFKFPAKHVCCHVPLISDVIFWNSVMDNNSNEMGLVAYNFEPEYSEEMT
jgi:hypothetical protein